MNEIKCERDSLSGPQAVHLQNNFVNREVKKVQTFLLQNLDNNYKTLQNIQTLT